METLFIDRKNTQLSIDHGRIKMALEDGAHSSLPLRQLRSIVISCDCQITTGMLRTLAKEQVSLICLNNRDPEASFVGTNEHAGNIHRRIQQYQILSQPEHKSRLAVLLVKQKIRLQRKALTEYIQYRPDLAGPFSRTQGTMLGLQRTLSKHTKLLSLNDILGIEGAAAKHYFNDYQKLFPPVLEFTGRNKRPPKDPVNVLLSLSYSIIHYEAKRACLSHSLDPYLGVLHRPSYNRASLACDLTELLRTHADQWVWQLIKHKTLRKDHFQQQNGACLLTKTGRSHFYQALPDVLPQWRETLRTHAGTWARHLDNFGES